MSQLKLNDFKEKVGDEWWKYLKPFFESKEAWDIYQVLKKDSAFHKITPKSSDTWKFLKEIHPDTVKVIVIGLDAYPGMYNKETYHATGIPFDCSNSPTGKLQPSLEAFWDGLSEDLDEELPHEADLKFLLQQGLFLGNRGITCKMYGTESHIPLWDDFWKYFFQYYVSQRPDIPIVFLGKSAAKLRKFVEFNKVFEISHPSASARTGQTWDTKKTFTNCNNIIKSLNGPDYMIRYNKKEYEKWLDEIPF